MQFVSGLMKSGISVGLKPASKLKDLINGVVNSEKKDNPRAKMQRPQLPKRILKKCLEGTVLVIPALNLRVESTRAQLLDAAARDLDTLRKTSIQTKGCRMKQGTKD